MYERIDKRRIYHLIEMYLSQKIDEATFCRDFVFTYDTELDYDTLIEEEYTAFSELGKVASRFSEFDEDIKKYPGTYSTKAELKNAIIKTKEKLKMKNHRKRHSCPCCGFLTRSESDYGTFEICPICNWEDDYVQANNPNYKGGANQESLNEARDNYKKFGASAQKYIKEVRPPQSDEIP